MIAVRPESAQRIAIIGAGVSGLVCAHHLHRQADVTVFEANDYPGGHTNTVDVEIAGRRWAVDTGFIVFNETHYPRFTRLLRELDVAWKPTTMSFSVRCDVSGVEYNGSTLGGLFAQRRSLLRPSHYGMLRDILRFHREAPRVLEHDDDDRTVEAFIAEERYGAAFAERFLVPMGAALWSAPARRFRTFPIRFVVEFMSNHAMLTATGRPVWQVVQGGSRTYVEAMIRPFADRIRLQTPVHRVRRTPFGVEVSTGRDVFERFDHVIFACHSDQALAMLDAPTTTEQTVLAAFPYQENTAVLHTDPAVLPRRRRAWAAWNYHRPRHEPDRVTVTYQMNMLQGLACPEPICVTLNEEDDVDPAPRARPVHLPPPALHDRAAPRPGPSRTS